MLVKKKKPALLTIFKDGLEIKNIFEYVSIDYFY